MEFFLAWSGPKLRYKMMKIIFWLGDINKYFYEIIPIRAIGCFKLSNHKSRDLNLFIYLALFIQGTYAKHKKLIQNIK